MGFRYPLAPLSSHIRTLLAYVASLLARAYGRLHVRVHIA